MECCGLQVFRVDFSLPFAACSVAMRSPVCALQPTRLLSSSFFCSGCRPSMQNLSCSTFFKPRPGKSFPGLLFLCLKSSRSCARYRRIFVSHPFETASHGLDQAHVMQVYITRYSKRDSGLAAAPQRALLTSISVKNVRSLGFSVDS